MIVAKPAKKLSDLLHGKMVLETPSTTSGMKIGHPLIQQFHLCANQNNQFMLGGGPSLQGYVFPLTEEQAFDDLASEIIKLKKVKFHLPILPITRGIDYCSGDIYGSVTVRVIEFYAIEIDEILTRYDVIVQAIG